jgi:hypothetical protein
VERQTAGYVNALPNGSLHEPVSDGIGYERYPAILFGRDILVVQIYRPSCAAYAQAQSPAPSEDTQPAITDQKLDQTAAAIKRVASVKQNYQQRIAAAPSSGTAPRSSP